MRKTWNALGLCLLMLVPSSVAQTPEEVPYLDTPNVEKWVRDKIVFDVTGRLIEETHEESAGWYDLYVTGLPPNATGLTLRNPLGTILGRDMQASAAGTVLFPAMRFMWGPHTVTQTIGTVDVVVATFEKNVASTGESSTNSFYSYPVRPAREESDDNTADSGSPSEPQSSGGPQSCPQGPVYHEQVTSQIKWTPLIISTSPYRGWSSASSSFNNAEAEYVLAHGYTSSLQTGPAVELENGASAGIFQLVRWTGYKIYYRQMDCEVVTRYATMLTDHAPLGPMITDRFGLTGGDPTTGRDDVVQFNAEGYNSTMTEIRFRYVHQNLKSTDGPHSWNVGDSGSIIWHVSFDVGLQHARFPASAGYGVYRGEKEQGTAYTWTYSVPQSSIGWNVTHHNGQKHMWAFCDRAFNSCKSG
jgi:hypothetical protein